MPALTSLSRILANVQCGNLTRSSFIFLGADSMTWLLNSPSCDASSFTRQTAAPSEGRSFCIVKYFIE